MEQNKKQSERYQLVIEGNSIYEIDLECVREKQKKERIQKEQKKGQRK